MTPARISLDSEAEGLPIPAPVTWKQAAQTDPDRKWRRLKAHKLWDEIEIRLRHRWSPRKVTRWLEHEYPKAERVSFKTLYRYLEDKPGAWFVSELVVAGAPKKYQGRVSRLMVLEEHAEAILLQKMRIREMREFEQKMEGMPVSEVRANLELLDRMFEHHLKMQQVLGYMPSGGGYSGLKGAPLGEDNADDGREFRTFVEYMVKLPSDEFCQLLLYALGPPPPGTMPVDDEPPPRPGVIDVTPGRVGAD